jgi:IS5 family transposase
MGVRLRLSDPELADSLRDFLERRECAVVQLEADILDVSLPHELHAAQARLELDLYLRVWQSLHQWTPVEYVLRP